MSKTYEVKEQRSWGLSVFNKLGQKKLNNNTTGYGWHEHRFSMPIHKYPNSSMSSNFTSEQWSTAFIELCGWVRNPPPHR